jgi:uncharacterized damage-inducible protein DinB
MPRTSEDKKRELIDGLVSARRSILNAVSDLPTDQVDQVFLGEWSIKDILAHLVGWDITNRQAVQEILAGVYPEFFQYYDKDWHSYNARLVEANKAEPFSALLTELDVSYRQLIATLESLPANDLVNASARRATGRTVTIRNLLKAEAADERQHALQIREFFV